MMKRLIALILPFVAFGQDLYLDHSYINEPVFQVGDTITIKFNTIDNNGALPRLIQFDFEYNNKILQKVGQVFTVQSQTAQKNFNHWDGYKMNVNPSVSPFLLKDQYLWWAGEASQAGSYSYAGNADWSVERITVQDSYNIPFGDSVYEISFIIRDITGTQYTSYDNASKLNWARISNSAGYIYDVHGMTNSISLVDVSGGDADVVTINLNTPAKADHAEDFMYEITMGGSIVDSGNFDGNGQALIQGLENDQEYEIFIRVDGTPDWLDEVVTVTDVYNVFMQAIKAGDSPMAQQDHFTYQMQFLQGEVTNNGNIDFDDSYAMLAHVSGVETSANVTSVANGAFNLSGNITHYGVATNDYYFGMKSTFTPTREDKIFGFAHGLRGDVDFSHSYAPEIPGASWAAKTVRTAKGAVNSTIDVSTSLVDGKVEVLVQNIALNDITGMQLVMDYNDDLLSFDTVVFDTGNTMPNFAKQNGNTIHIGSLDTQGINVIKQSKPYRVLFTPKQSIQNTAGLVYFKLIDAVKKDGTKVNITIQ